MRMSQEKVKDLAAQIVKMLDEHPGVTLQEREEALRVAVGSVILDDLEEEDDIDREVDALLNEHAREIDSQSMDHETLRRKFRDEIARRRGFTL